MAASSSSTSSSPIAPPQALVQGVSQTNQAIPQIDSAVSALLALPAPSGTSLASLPGDVSKACSDANEWNTTYRAQVISTLQGVVNWNTTFNGFYNQLQSLATQIAAGDTSAVAPFQTILQQLQTATQGIATTTAGVASQLISFSTLISSDIATLNGDQSQLQTMQKSDTQQAQQDQQEVQSLETEQQKDQHLYDSIRSIPIFGRYLAPLEESIQAISGHLSNVRNAANDASDDSTVASAEANAAGAAASDAGTANTDLGAISSGVGALDQGWNSLDANFAELISSESITTYDVFTPALLEATQADWNNLATQAASFLSPAPAAQAA
jgi:hypothetical protein